MSVENSIIIVGPCPSKNMQGGVATHIKTLTLLSTFSNANIFDSDSIKWSLRSLDKLVINLLEFKRASLKRDIALINSSIYFTAFVKLLLMVIFCRAGKTIVFFHGGRFGHLNSLNNPIFREISWLILRKCKHFFFLSNQQLHEFQNVFPKFRCCLYRNYSFDENPIPKSVKPIFTFLFVGRVVKEKGIFEILEAASRLSDNRLLPPFKVKVVGDGPALEEVKTRVAGSSVFEFLGFLSGDAITEQYRSSDVLLFPTYHPEGFPYVVIEAFRAGVPVISTSEGALAELVRDGENGFKINARAPIALSQKMEFFLKNPDARERMSASCYKDFSETMTNRSAELFYRDLVYKLAS